MHTHRERAREATESSQSLSMKNVLITDFNFLFTLFYMFYKNNPLLLLLFFIVLRVDPRTLHILSKCSTTEVYIQLSNTFIGRTTLIIVTIYIIRQGLTTLLGLRHLGSSDPSASAF